MKTEIIKKCKKIKVLLTDVDGVLTDGGMYYSTKGDIMKKIYVRDGMGVNILKRNNIPTIIVTKEKNPVVTKWAKNMNVYQVLNGVIKKELVIEKICKKLAVKVNEIAFIGDDVNDLELMKKVGFSATPFDGIKEAIKISDYHCKSKGGKGAYREIVDLIIFAKFGLKKVY